MFLRWSTFDIQKKNTQHKNIKGGKKPQTTPRSCDQKGSAPCWAEGVGQPGWCDGLEVDWFLVDVFFFTSRFFFGVWCCDILEVGKSDLLCKVTTTKSDISDTSGCVEKDGKLETWKALRYLAQRERAGLISRQEVWGCEDVRIGVKEQRIYGIENRQE